MITNAITEDIMTITQDTGAMVMGETAEATGATVVEMGVAMGVAMWQEMGEMIEIKDIMNRGYIQIS